MYRQARLRNLAFLRPRLRLPPPVPTSSDERVELAYQQLFHQLIGEPVLKAGRPPLTPFLRPLPYAIRRGRTPC